MAETIGRVIGKALKLFARWFLVGLALGLGLRVSGIWQ